jgi:hypothetical protein
MNTYDPTAFEPIPPEEYPIAQQALAEFNESGTPDDEQLIVLEQMPRIKNQLFRLKDEVQAATTDALALDCTEDTVKEIKRIRAELNKRRKPFDDRMREIKRQLLEPYTMLEQVYKECVAGPLSDADTKLRDKINTVESTLKAAKQVQVQSYFDELCAANSIDFLTLRDTGVNVTLSVTVKALREQVQRFVVGVAEDIDMISTQEHGAEILVEYKHNGYNASAAIATVTRRVQAIADERQRQIDLAAQREQQAAHAQRVEEVAAQFAPPEAIDVPIEVSKESMPQEEPEIEMTIKVRATREKLIAWREYMKQEGITYVTA